MPPFYFEFDLLKIDLIFVIMVKKIDKQTLLDRELLSSLLF
jgi:hypothetical protein